MTIELDEDLLLSAAKHSNGANAHDINEAVSFYKRAVKRAQFTGNERHCVVAQEYAHSLRLLLIAAERQLVSSESSTAETDDEHS